jgi:hypothetical protein
MMINTIKSLFILAFLFYSANSYSLNITTAEEELLMDVIKRAELPLIATCGFSLKETTYKTTYVLILETEEYKQRGSTFNGIEYYPVHAYIQGECTRQDKQFIAHKNKYVITSGKPELVEKKFLFIVFKNDFGKWVAKRIE